MRTNLKRALCLFLTLIMLTSLFPVEAFAANFMGPGIGTAPPGGSPVGNNDTKWTYAQTVGAGILLDVAQSEKNTASDENWAENVRYWTENFPSTSAEGSTPDGYYVLPNKHQKYTQYAIQMKETGNIDWSCAPIYGVYMYDSNTVKNNIGLGAYTKATGNISDSNPSPNLPADYWRKEIPIIAKDGAGNIISNLFSATDPSFGYKTAADTEAINQRILDYLGRAGGQNSAVAQGIQDPSAREMWDFFMYCGFIANVIACLPKHEQAQKAAQLDSMCQNYLKGEPYQPMVVTGELVVASEYNNNNTEVYWWTAKQCIRAVTGAFPSNLKIMGGDDFLTRIAEDCHKAQKNYGGRNMYGHPEGGQWVKSGYNPQYGWLLQSLSQSTLNANQVGSKPIPGFGVWGLGDKPPERQNPIPPTSAEKGKMTPMGDCGIEVMEKTYIEESLSYSEELEVTINVNLNGKTNSTTTTTSEAGSTSSSVDGVGIANSLRWLKQ